MSFNNVFGGGVLQPSNVGYQAIALTANLTLAWPTLSQGVGTYVASINDVTPSGGGFTITMPPANQVSTGADILWRNLGAFNFSILDNAGVVIATLTPGQTFYMYLKDNTSLGGGWNTVLFGVGSSMLDAAALVGYGLIAIANTLNQAHPSVTVISGAITPDATYRAKLIVWTGGAGTMNLPAVGAVGDNYFILVRNSGSGSLTITPAGIDTIDGAANAVLQPTESCFVCVAGTTWFTIGRGRSIQFAFTQLNKVVATGTYVLTAGEAANAVQKYTGALAGNVIVVLPSVVGVYYLDNETTNAFSLTFETATPGTVFSLPQSQRAIVVCDGINVVGANTVISGASNIVFNPGTVVAPSIAFTGDLSTGIYQPVLTTFAMTCNGNEVVRFTTTSVLFSQPLIFSSPAIATSSRTNMGTTQEAETIALALA